MNEHLQRRLDRWRDAEDAGRDSEADEAFTGLFRSVSADQVVSRDFTARTMAAVAAAADRDARRARRMRRILLPSAAAGLLVGGYVSAGWIVRAVSAAVVWTLNLLIGALVSGATAVQQGPDGWTVVTSVGRAAAAVIANPAVTITIFAVQAFAIAALVVLQRLLGSDRESFR
jgi:hypothetical protein